jgi:LytS/YehU family sensor histidine kinase
VSDFLRLTLTAPVRDEVPLADEIDYVKQYLEIERVRFGDRLRVEFDVATDAWEAVVPSFVLQPIIENAVRHAIAPREAGGTIVIEAQRVGDLLRVAIVDDGPGVSGEMRANGNGRIGLANTRNRLREMYGEQGRLELTNGTGRGTRVMLELPFRRPQSVRSDLAGSIRDA